MKVREMSKIQKQRSRSYYAKKLTDFGYRVDVKMRSIDIEFNDLSEVPVGPRYYVRQLLRIGFSKQTRLF